MQEYLLDTNAYFKLLCYISKKTNTLDEDEKIVIKNIIDSECSISKITLIEIISVIGKYSRGSSASKSKCQCIISHNGDKCNNDKHETGTPKWNKRETKAWLDLTKEIKQGKSPLLKLKIVDFDDTVISEAESIIQHSLIYKFASMDAIIIATSKCLGKNGKNICIITSDKSMTAAMKYMNMSCNDILKHVTFARRL